MSLETHVAGSEDRLLDSLHFSGRTSASYITERRSVQFHPSSASSFKPSGVRLIRWNLADHAGWLDGSTVRLIFTLTNLGANAITPCTDSPASMFRRWRVIASGSSPVEDIEEYGRVHQMFCELLPSQRRYNDICESWGSLATGITLDSPTAAEPLAPGASRQVCVHFLSSFLSQGKFIPLSMLPVVVEAELGDADDAFAETGTNWEITRPRLVAEVSQMDVSLQNSFAKTLLDGKTLPMYMTGIYSVKGAVANASLFSFPISRGFSRLSTIYCSFYDAASGFSKWTNRFVHPSVAAATNTTATDTMTWTISLGADKYPVWECESTQESFYRLRLAQLNHQGTDSFSISPLNYRRTKFLIGQTLEKAPGMASHSGVNTRSGSQLTLQFRNLGPATMVHVVLIYEQILELSAGGVSVLD